MDEFSKIVISYKDTSCYAAATDFAKTHSLNCLQRHHVTSGLCLNFTADYIELCDLDAKTQIHIDFLAGALAHRKRYGGGKGQAIAKAIGLKSNRPTPTVLDATAGLAKDSFVMASLGCKIIMVEQSAIIAQLIADAIERSQHDPDFKQILKTGFTLIQKNSMKVLQGLESKPDVIYLDPMYPLRKKTALVKKNMQILQKLLGEDHNSEQLLELSLLHAKNRVVIKRPKLAQQISERIPDTCIESKTTRYDIYLTHNSH